MLTINAGAHFKRSFKRLPVDIRKDFENKISAFSVNPFEFNLRTHKLRGKLSKYYSFCLREGYRVLFRFGEPNEVLLLDIGKHDDYKKWGKNKKMLG